MIVHRRNGCPSSAVGVGGGNDTKRGGRLTAVVLAIKTVFFNDRPDTSLYESVNVTCKEETLSFYIYSNQHFLFYS